MQSICRYAEAFYLTFKRKSRVTIIRASEDAPNAVMGRAIRTCFMQDWLLWSDQVSFVWGWDAAFDYYSLPQFSFRTSDTTSSLKFWKEVHETSK